MNDREPRAHATRPLLFVGVLSVVAAGGCKSRSSGDVSPDTRSAGRQAPRPVEADAARACLDGSACVANEYCAFKPRLCGVSSKPVKPEYERGLRPGTCRPRPASCDAAYSPVCGCDKRVYRNECEANLAGVDLNVNDGCFENSPRDWISCGERFCNAHTHYCEIVLSDVFELPTDYTCKALPASCVPDGGSARSCDCFAKGTRCLDWCGYIVSGEHGLPGFHLTCRL